MKLFLAFMLSVTTILIHDNNASLSQFDDTNLRLQHVIASDNCSSLLNFKHKLSNSNYEVLVTIPSGLEEQLDLKIQKLNCSPRRKRQYFGCAANAEGDGYCDAECNKPEYHWDKGDCCPHTCNLLAIYPCGYGGYNCIASNPNSASKNPDEIPHWFKNGVKLCYHWNWKVAEGQCGTPGATKHTCAHVNTMTDMYRDGTNNQPGGCLMKWSIESTHIVPDWFKETTICVTGRAFNGHGISKCNYGITTEVCAKFGKFTQEYYDDTDSTFAGGCHMAWKFTVPSNAEPWTKKIDLCMYWEPEQENGQCGIGKERRLCAAAGAWTSYYLDNTDNRPGGCKMQWGFYIR